MYYLGVDIGGMSIKCGIVDENGVIIGEKRTIVTPTTGGDDCVKGIADLCRDTVKANGLTMDDVIAIGLGVPGTVDGEVATFVSNLGWEDYPVCQKLKELVAKPVYAGNDANCAALAEWKFGAGKGYDNVVMVTLGTGVGTGFIVEGKLLLGYKGSGSEGGHMIIKAGGKKCNCGLCGCWERYAATTALLEAVEAEIANCPQGAIAQIAKENGGFDGKTLFYALDKGDKRAQEILQNYLEDISLGLINISNIFRPQIMVIGGGISKQERVVKPLEHLINDCAYGNGRNPYITVRPATFGNDAGIIGASLLALI